MNPGARSFWLLVVILFAISPVLLQAQQNATVTGLVLDEAGRPIAGAVVSLVNHSVGFNRQFKTDADGRYTFVQVKPGAQYVLTVEATDFQTYVAPEPVDVQVNQLFLWHPPINMTPAQVAKVTGLVLDEGGKPIAGAVVSLVNHSVGFNSSDKTDAGGQYTFVPVKPGSEYVLTVEATNFETYVSPPVGVQVSEILLNPPIKMTLNQEARQRQREAESSKATEKAEIRPQQAAKPTIAFIPSKTTVLPGESIQLQWDAQNADKVRIEPEIGDVEIQGHRDVKPPSSITYVAIATGPGGGSSATVSVTVVAPSPPRPAVSPDQSMILSGVVDSKMVHDLPLENRDFTALALLVAGTYPLEQASPLQGASLVVNGVPGNMNNFLLDGTDNNDYTVNQSLPFQIVEAMQEFRVQTSTSTAEFGRSAGSQINVVSQSGANQWHGELFELNRNSAISANNAISTYTPGTFNAFAQDSRVNQIEFGAASPFPTQVLSDPALSQIFKQGNYVPLNTNQFGANIGGPIKKDKAFFFFNWESFRGYDGRRVMDRVPDIESRSQASCAAALGTSCDPGVQALLNLYPAPNVPTSSVKNLFGYPVSNPVNGDVNLADPCYFSSPDTTSIRPSYPCSGAFFVGAAANSTSTNNYLARIDFNPSQQTLTSFKYNIQDFNQVQAGDLPASNNYPGSGITTSGQNQNLSFNYVQNFGTSSSNKLTLGWNRFFLNTLPLDHVINAGSYFHNLNVTDYGLPTIAIGGLDFTWGPYSNVGAGFNAPYSRADTVWSVSDDFSKLWGAHTLQFGGQYRYNKLNVDNEAAARGLVTFFTVPYALSGAGVDGGSGGSADLASIARVSPDFGGNAAGIGSMARKFTDNSFALYAQDTWRLRPNLTLYYGLRYEVSQAPVEANNRLVNDYPGACTAPNGLQLVCLMRGGSNQIFYNDGTPLGTASFTAPRAGFHTDYNNFGPRFGFAWSPGSDGLMVIRGGFAVMFNQQSLEPSVNMLLNPPFIQQTAGINVPLSDVFPAGFLTPTQSTDGGNFFGQSYSITARDVNTRTSYVYQYHFGIERQLGNQNVFGLSYVGSTGHKLPVNLLLLECTSSDFNGQNPEACLPPLGTQSPNQLSNSIVFQENEANSSYNSVLVQLRTRNYHGLTLQAYYQWAHSIDNAPTSIAPVFLYSPTAASAITDIATLNRDQLAGINNVNPALTLRPGLPVISTPDSLPNNTTNDTSLASQRASSDFDIRHRFVIAYTYAVPSWKRAGILGSGWQLGGITTIQSGQPYSAYSNFFGVPLRPDPQGTTTLNYSNPGGAIDNGLPAGCPFAYEGGCPGSNQVSSFNPGPTFNFEPGSLARNTFYGPAFINFDFSVLKNTRIRESMNLQFRAEFFNIFNRSNFRQPFSQTGQFESDPISSSSPSTVLNPFFGQILQAYAGRQIQFGLKLVF